MPTQKIAMAVTLTNLSILAMLLAGAGPSPQRDAGVIRGRSLEIVDDAGRVRASIKLQEPVTVDGVEYPETVVFRLIGPNGRPVVKASGSDEGGGVGVVGRSDETRAQLVTADGEGVVKLMNVGGRERILKVD